MRARLLLVTLLTLAGCARAGSHEGDPAGRSGWRDVEERSARCRSRARTDVTRRYACGANTCRRRHSGGMMLSLSPVRMRCGTLFATQRTDPGRRRRASPETGGPPSRARA
jgi:hypothetical protein